MSSLAAQLAGIRANNNATILNKSKRKKIHSVSLIYPSKKAATQDFESIYYDCLEAFRELVNVDDRFDMFSNSLFSETSIRFDRQVQNSEQNTALNKAIDQFLMLCSGYLHLQPSLHALEWIVRRFQIQIHNVEALLLSVLPWHDEPVFVRIMDIIYQGNLPSNFQFLQVCKSSMQGPSKATLLRVFSRDQSLFDTFNSWSLQLMSLGFHYNRQLVFWGSMNSLILLVYKEQGDQVRATDQLLPLISEVVVLKSQPAAQIAGYMVLVVIASQFRLSTAVLDAAIESVVFNWTTESCRKGLQCVAQLVAALHDELDSVFVLKHSTYMAIANTFGSIEAVKMEIIDKDGADKFAATLILSSLVHMPLEFVSLAALVKNDSVKDMIMPSILEFIVKNAPFDDSITQCFVEIIEKTALSTCKLDQLEIALQTTIRRHELVSAIEDDDKTIVVDTKPDQDTSNIMEEISNMEQSTQRTFLDHPLPTSDRRAQLWSLVASQLPKDLDELRQIARVAPEAQLSFVLAVSLGPWPTLSRISAIRVASALITSTLQCDPSCADFQCILPIVLFLLSDPEPRIRREAGVLLKSVGHNKPGNRSPRWFIGTSTENLSWLNKHDLANVLKKLVENSEECELDAAHVFSAVRQAGKAAWCDFLVSHAVNTHIPQILWVTLKCLASFKGVTKPLSSALLSNWNAKNVREQWKQLCKDAKFPLSAVERALISVLKSNDESAVSFLLELMRTRDLAVAQAVADHFQQIWQSTYKPETQSFIAEALVDICIDDAIQFDPTSLLFQLPLSSGIFVKLLEDNKSQSSEPPLFNEASKRRRRRSSSALQLRNGPYEEITAAAEKHLRHTTLVLELLEPRTLELVDTPPLISLLFDTLERLMALGEGSARLPVLYTEELLANCMTKLVESFKPMMKNASHELNSIKVNVVVACIRTSTSPQVQNRLLLLVASLATLCPDAVLHGVMPIFTFMGANTVRLDNDFSAHVIQQTIEKVIPALVNAGDKHEEIEMALMSFVAAFPHVPRHRRNTLFGALIKTLGPQQSLYKLLLLLGQRYAEALTAPSRRLADAKSLIHFTTPFLRSFSAADQMNAINSFVKFVIEEAEQPAKFSLLKIKENVANSEQLQNLFLEFLVRTAGDSESIAGTQPLRVQAVSGPSALTESQWQVATSLISNLISQELPATQQLLVKLLEMLPIERFTNVCIPLIEPNNSRVLDLVVQKFKDEAVDDKTALQSAEIIVEKLLLLIREGKTTSMVIDAAESIIAKFGNYMRNYGQQLLTLLIGSNGLQNADDNLIISACLGINSVCQHLGAATYKYFPQFFPSLCRQISTTTNEDVKLAGFALIAGLVKQMPRFMEAEIPTILELVLSSKINVTPRLQLVKILNDKITPRTLLKVLCKSWNAANIGGLNSVEMLFIALDDVQEKVSSRDLAAEIGGITDLLIGCFAVREQLCIDGNVDYNYINQVESRAIEWGISSVLKVNDRIFRPQFKRIIDWAFSTSPSPSCRHISVLKFVNRVFGRLKGIVTNYYGYLLEDACKLLESAENDAAVKKLVYQSLITSITYDQDDFWQEPSRFDKISTLFVSQLTNKPMTHGPLIVKSIIALAQSSSPQNRKRLNDDLSRLLVASADATQKLWTIRVFSGLYRRLGEDWIANLPQLVPLIAELLDDEDETVEAETRKSLVPVIEDILGESLDRYLA